MFFFGGILFGLVRRFNYMPIIGLTDPNFDAYKNVLTSTDFLLSFALTFHIAFTSAVISAVLAIAAARSAQTFAGKKLVTFLIQLNLTIPHIVGATVARRRPRCRT